MSLAERSPLKLVNDQARQPKPRASDWFWHPWYAKLFWMLTALYWIGLYIMMLVPTDWLNSLTGGAVVVLILLFNPITAVTILGNGFLKAKVACGDWVIRQGVAPEHAEWMKSEQEAADLNPVDIRSGYLHQQYLDDLAPYPTGHVGL